MLSCEHVNINLVQPAANHAVIMKEKQRESPNKSEHISGINPASEDGLQNSLLINYIITDKNDNIVARGTYWHRADLWPKALPKNGV